MNSIKDVSIAYADVCIMLNSQDDPDMDRLTEAVTLLNESQAESDLSIVDSISSALVNYTFVNDKVLDYLVANYKFFQGKKTITNMRNLVKYLRDMDTHSTDLNTLILSETRPETTSIRADMFGWEYVYTGMLLKTCQRLKCFDALIAIRNLMV